MSDAFKDVSTVPTLTLEPFQAEEEKKPAVQPEEPKLDDTILTEEERRMVDAFAQQIDLTNSSMILQYGAGTQKKMADFSESALENVKSKDLGEVGTLLTNVVTELKSFDEEESKGFLGIFKKASNKVESMKAKYSKAEENVNQIVKALETAGFEFEEGAVGGGTGMICMGMKGGIGSAGFALILILKSFLCIFLQERKNWKK